MTPGTIATPICVILKTQGNVEMDSLHTHVCVKQDFKTITVTQGTTVFPIYVIPKTQYTVRMDPLHTCVCVKQDLKAVVAREGTIVSLIPGIHTIVQMKSMITRVDVKQDMGGKIVMWITVQESVIIMVVVVFEEVIHHITGVNAN